MAEKNIEAPGQLLGPLEQLVLSAIASLGKEAYGVPIHAKVSEMLDRDVNMGSIYITLLRMQDKGLVSSEIGEATPERRGRPKRFYRLESPGAAALRESFNLSQRASEAASESWRFGKWKPGRSKT